MKKVILSILFGAKEEVLTDMLAVFKKIIKFTGGWPSKWLFSAEEEEIIQEDI